MEGVIPPRGLIVDLITPLTADGAVDGHGLARLLDRILPCAQGVLLCSPRMGEGLGLDANQRLDCLNKTQVIVRARIPIFVWVTQPTETGTRETLSLLRKNLRKPPDPGEVFWVDTPLYYHSNRGLPSHYRDLCSALADPLILDNDPSLIKGLGKPLKRRNVRTAILKELVSGEERIAGLIFRGPLERARHYQRAARQRDGFRLYDGDEGHFLDHPSTSGVISAGANLAPTAWERVTRFSLESGRDQGLYPDQLQQIWASGETLRRLKRRYQAMPVPIIKGVLSALGIIETPACTAQMKNGPAPPEPLEALMTQLREDPLCRPAART